MANFQIGQPGVSAFLQSLLRHLDVVMKMEDFIHFPIKMELKEMKKLLLGFECVLLDGERKRQHGVKDAERWMDDLKDLFYDIDDLLDEVKMEYLQFQQEITGEPSDSKVRYNHKHGFFTQENIKSMLNQVLDKLRERTEEVNRLQLKRDAVQHDAKWLKYQAKVRKNPGCYADEPAIHGLEEDKKRIIEMLLADNGRESRRNYEFVCVVGMGGLGKTTLAQLVFQDETVKRSFAVRGWACVSDVIYVIKVIQDLIESASERGDGAANIPAEVNAGIPDGAPNMLAELSAVRDLIEYDAVNAGIRDGAANIPSALPALQDLLKKTINDKKFLLVLDDVWTTKELEQLKIIFNFGAKGSKILVTTRQSKVAEDLRNKEPYKLEPLEDAQCLKIFNDNAFGEEDGIDNDRGLMKIGEEIVRKCKGVPLVAKVIGAMLTGKKEEEWKAVKDDGIWELAYKGEDLHPGLRLSYFYLPPCLKRCFEYFALFPTDFKFEQSELVRMWIAEGLIEVQGCSEPEEIGNQYYNDLKGRSLIQKDDKMHDMIHHLACIVAGFFFFRDFSGSCPNRSSSLCPRHVFTQMGPIVPNKLRTLIHKGELGLELFSYKRSRVLEVHTSLSHLPSSLGCDLKHLRYLKLTGMFWNSTLPDSICTLTNLQVLDLSNYKDLENLPQDVGKLSNLRFLGLASRYITVLPDSVCSLLNLQVLNLSSCKSLTTLPKHMGNLQSLHKLLLQKSSVSSLPESVVKATNIRVLEIDDGVALPAHIGKLTQLEELSKFCVGMENGRGIDELKGMNRLRGSLRIENMEKIESAEEALMANLRSKKHIVELEFVWKESDTALTGRDGEMELRIMEALEPNAAIKSLSFKNYVGHKFPSWKSTPPLHNLVKLYLINLPLMSELTGMEFESLLFLRLDNCRALREVSVTSPQLVTLMVISCQELIVLKLPTSLLQLTIWNCPNLRNLPYGFHDSTSLQQIDFWDCPSLEIRPDDPLPPSITRKYIYNCAKLDVKINHGSYVNIMSLFICLIAIYLMYYLSYSSAL